MRTAADIRREAVYRNCHTRELQVPAWAGDYIIGDEDRWRWECIRASTRIYEVWCDGFKHATLSVVTSVTLNEAGEWSFKTDGMDAVDDAICKAMNVTPEERAAITASVRPLGTPADHA